MGNSHNFQQIRQRTIKQRDQRIQRFVPRFEEIIKASKISPSRIEQLTRIDLVGLVAQLNKRSVTSEQLIAIFGLRAATLGRKYCIITEDYFQYALKHAQQCDQERAKTGKRNWTMDDDWNMGTFFPPLFGIPLSVKDNIPMEGSRTTIGITIRAQKVDKADCPTIKCLKHSGLIPFIKTNLPQLAFNFDSSNHLWGKALNPWNHNKSAGGSSGGQGAAIAARISPVGIGNDQAGSIRIPALFNGVCGLMVGVDRLPQSEQFSVISAGFTGMDTIKAVNGPLSKSIDSLALWMKIATTEEFYLGQHDAYKNLVPFNTKVYKQFSEGNTKFKIGVLQGLDLIEPTPANKRALAETVEYLRKQGHQTVKVEIPHQQEVVLSIFGQLVGEGGMESFIEALEGEELVNQYKETKLLVSLNCALFNCAKCITGCSQPRMELIIEACRKKTAHQYLQSVGKIYEYRNEWVKYWRAQQLDFVILPGFASEALNHGGSSDGSLLAAYTYIFNILGMVSAALPITLTRANELVYESRWSDRITDLVKKSLKDAEGMPVGIQVIGLPFSEEKVLGLSKRIEKHFKFSENHPLPDNP